MSVETIRWKEELQSTKQYLAEVIDECVFVERQRSLTEQRLSSQLDIQRNIVTRLFATVRLLCSYTSLLEGHVLSAVAHGSSANSAALEAALRMRKSLAQRLDLEETVDEFKPLFRSPPIEEDYRVPRTGNPLAAQHEFVATVMQHKTELLNAMDAARQNVASLQTSASEQEREVDELRARIDTLSALVKTGTIEKRTMSPYSPGEDERNTPSLCVSCGRSAAAEQMASAKLLAYEKTVYALNSELAILHENYNALSHASSSEMADMKALRNEEQRRYKEQIGECDAVLGRLSLELEQLILENAQMKQKLREVGGSGRGFTAPSRSVDVEA